MFSKIVDDPEVNLNSADSKEGLKAISQESASGIPNNPPNAYLAFNPETEHTLNPDDLKGLKGIQKASALLTLNLSAPQIIKNTLEICHEIIPFNSGNILLNHSGKWQSYLEENEREFEIAFASLRNEGLVDLMFREQRYLVSSAREMLFEDSYKEGEEIFSFPMILDSSEIGICMLFVDEDNSGISLTDLESIKIIVNQAAMALKHGEAQKQLARQEQILDNFKQLLIRALKMVLVGELAKGITHEINNPLQIILGKIQMAALGSNHQDALKHVEKQSLQIASLVRTISDISKNRNKDSVEIIEINSFLQHSIGLIRGQIEKRGIEIHLNLDNETIPIHSNSDYLRQLILNSTLNAKKRMSSGGHFTVSTSVVDSNTIQIEFKDDGAKLEGNFNKTILNYAVEMDKLYQLNVDLGEITNILLVKEIGGVIDYQSHKSFGNKIIIRIPQNRQDTS